MNLPNKLTILRTIMIPVFLIFLYIPGLGRSMQEIFKMLPYLVTLLAVVLAVKDVRPPASMGKVIEEKE